MDAADRRVATYSGGMKRRLDLAMSLVIEPVVLFLDEPTTGLDPRSRMAVWEAVSGLVDDGVTVLLTTQYLEEADRLANRIAVIDERPRRRAGHRRRAQGPRRRRDPRRGLPGGDAMTASLTFVGRSLRHSVRSIDSLLTSLMLPVSILLMFVYVFGGAIQSDGRYVDYVVPGIIVLCAGFGSASVAVAVALDMTNGVIDRFRTLPISAGRGA